MEQQTKPTALKAGDILYSSWGYDQTNIDFYEVIKGAEPGKFATLVELKDQNVPGGGCHSMSASKIPATGPDRFDGQAFKKKVKASAYFGVSVKIESYASAYPWDGTPKFYSWDH